MGEKYSRRKFLKGMTTGAVGIATIGLMGGCAPKTAGSESTSSIPEKWDMEADIVICGAGGTGLAAAAEAALQGADVLVLEKASTNGGTTRLSGGVLQAAGTKYQKELTLFQEDTPEKHFQYWKACGEGFVNEELIRDMAENAPSQIAWMEERGLTYDLVYGPSQIPYLSDDINAYRIHSPAGGGGRGSGGVHVDAILATCEEKGVRIEYDTTVTELLIDKSIGVIGVRATTADGEKFVKAKKGVIVATAGIDRNIDMARDLSNQQYYDLVNNLCQCPESNTGDGIRMGMEIGAAVCGFGGTIDSMVNGVGGGTIYPDGPQLLINGAGRRFVCENSTYAYGYRAIYQQELQLNHPCYLVFGKSALEEGSNSKWVLYPGTLDDALEKGTLIKVETIEELATGMDVDLDNLRSTFEQWNSDLETYGEDKQFGRKNGLLPIEASYYYMKCTCTNLGALGGLKIDVNAKVLDHSDNPIPHLFAGGMCTGGWIGQYYPGSGTAILGTVHWGRKAADSAVATEPWA